MSTESAEARQAVINLMLGAVPERARDIHERWRRYDPAVVLVPSTRGFTLNATKERIAYDPKIMDVFWLIGFSGWKAIECYSPHVVGSIAFGGPVADWMLRDEHLYTVESDYKARRGIAQTLIDAADLAVPAWPPDIPRLTSNREDLGDPQHKTAFDLTLIAIALAFFHEFEHVIFDHDGTRPTDRRDEELKCDVLAREFMTVKLAAYAAANGHDYQQVLRKRSMGFALAALVLHEITPSWDHGGSQEYFSVATRLQAILDNTPLEENDPFWVFTASLLVGIFRQRHSIIDAPSTNGKALTRHLIDRL